MALLKRTNNRKNQIFSRIPIFGNSSRNDENIDRGKKEKASKNRGGNSHEELFRKILPELREYVIGQDEYTEKLCIAFERPFLYDNGKTYSNLSIVFGPDGSGRYYGIRVITTLLCHEKALKNPNIYNLDFSNYDSDTVADKLLFPDLYKALYGKEEVVVISNFDKGSPRALECITSLVENGAIKVDKRFNWDRGNLQEASGTYSLGTINTLSANGKYIFLLSTKPKSYLSEHFSAAFIAEVPDVMTTNYLQADELREILISFLDDIQESLQNRMNITTDFSVLQDPILSDFHYTKGAHELQSITNKKIYGSFVNLVLNNKLHKDSNVVLSSSGGKVYADNIFVCDLKQGINEDGIQKIKKEISEIIGLDSVKEFLQSLENQIRFEQKQEREKTIAISRHMVFCGNPGTGKTTVARITAEYLKALGCLSGGQMIETSRKDLIGQYVGETAQKTSAVLNRAKGGVLFIDEAYSLARGKNDSFGVEAVDTLVKFMEDNREDFVVILAGYSKEMEDFLDINSGLKSRFNYTIEFPDYSAQEMVEITNKIAEKNGFQIEDMCCEALEEYYSRLKKSLKQNFGNGRTARNTIEAAIIRHSNRIIEIQGLTKTDTNNILTMNDFDIVSLIRNTIDEKELSLVKEEMNSILGLKNAKEFLYQLEAQIRFERQRGETDSSSSKHMVFVGNPGTGKTTFARLTARYLKALGCLSKGQFVETSRQDLVGQYVGETAQKTTKVVEKAYGGVLFIDEAYSIARGKNDSFGMEAVDTLIKLMEDLRDDLVVILAGYTKEIDSFLTVNPGLKSRINNRVLFEDYSAEELFEITELIAKSKKYSIDEKCRKSLLEYFDSEIKKNGTEFGNGRFARNVVEKAINTHAVRYLNSVSLNTSENVSILSLEDFEINSNIISKPTFDLEYELSKLIGLEEVKNHIRSLYSFTKLNQARRKMGLTVDKTQTLHMIFEGNPGTGKTTVARIIGRMFYSLGLLESEKVVETDRAGLVAGYVGQTSIKTKEMINSALGGILFIDEAYSLSEGNANDFGHEAINTLIKDMDDNRERLVVILAGYKNNMMHFLSTNPGLASRFPNIIEFSDYNKYELLRIAQTILSSKGYKLDSDAEKLLGDVFDKACLTVNFGNGRYVRNTCEQLIRNLSVRIENIIDLTPELVSTIVIDDIVQLSNIV